MGKDIKAFVARTLLLAAIVPLFIFSFIFLGQTFQFFIQRDDESIKSILEREQKYLEYLVEVNIKDMLVVSTSDNIRTQKVEEFFEVFERVMKVRNDFYKMKYVTKDGYTVEVIKGKPGSVYTRDPLGIVETTCTKKGEFAMYSSEGEEGGYIVFSAPFKVDGEVEAVVLGYLPADHLKFITSNINLNAVGNIFIRDSRGNVLVKHGDGEAKGKSDIEYNIKNTDWVLSADIDYSYFERLFYENILVKLIIFLVLVVILIIPFSIHGGNYFRGMVVGIIQNMKSLKRLDEADGYYRIDEMAEFRKSFNKVIDTINDDIKFETDEFYIDKLTGLYNKMYIEDKLAGTFHEGEDKGAFFLMIDIASSVGISGMTENPLLDVVLAEIGEIISEGIRFRDIAIRFSEDKFLVVLRNLDQSRAVKIASSLKDTIEYRVAIMDRIEIKVILGIGVAKYEGDMYKTISNAERALREAKVSRGSKIKYMES